MSMRSAFGTALARLRIARCPVAGLILFGLLGVSGCVTAPSSVGTLPSTSSAPGNSASSSEEKVEAAMSHTPMRHHRRGMPLMKSRPLDIQLECKFKNETGYNGSTVLGVENGEVKRFSANINIPDRGQCQFDMTAFVQIQKVPTVELHAHKSPCLVRMWEQGRQIAVAFSNCQQQCSPGSSFSYLWPILIDRPTGRCD